VGGGVVICFSVPNDADYQSVFVPFTVVVPYAGDWKFKVMAGFADNNSNQIPSSVSEIPFTIRAFYFVNFMVRVPPLVPVKVDGHLWKEGLSGGKWSFFFANVSVGRHSISVPEIVLINGTTRLGFNSWSWGNSPTDYSHTSNASNLTIDVSTGETWFLSANYTPQNSAPLSGQPSSASTVGWYNEGSPDLYVADFGNRRIVKFDSYGKLLTHWGFDGIDNSELHIPSGIAVDSSGNVYVTDPGNNCVQKFGYANPSSYVLLPIVGVAIVIAAIVIMKRCYSRESKRKKARFHFSLPWKHNFQKQLFHANHTP
jgi:hypothetical protein